MEFEDCFFAAPQACGLGLRCRVGQECTLVGVGDAAEDTERSRTDALDVKSDGAGRNGECGVRVGVRDADVWAFHTAYIYIRLALFRVGKRLGRETCKP